MQVEIHHRRATNLPEHVFPDARRPTRRKKKGKKKSRARDGGVDAPTAVHEIPQAKRTKPDTTPAASSSGTA